MELQVLGKHGGHIVGQKARNKDHDNRIDGKFFANVPETERRGYRVQYIIHYAEGYVKITVAQAYFLG